MIALTRGEVQETLGKMLRMSEFKGDGTKKLTVSEKRVDHNISFRRGIYFSRDMKIGKKICAVDLKVLRPTHGVCVSKFYDIIGKIITRDVLKVHALQVQDICH